MRKGLFLIFFIFSLSIAKEVYKVNIENINIKNLPDSYLEIFSDFFKQNLNAKKKNTSITININWISYSYNICIFVKNNKVLKEALCTTCNFAEELWENIENLLKDSDYLVFRYLDRKIINLRIISKGKPTEKKIKLISPKGDYLTDYKENINIPKEPVITIGGANASVDLIVLNEISASYILNKLLNNYKINRIYITN